MKGVLQEFVCVVTLPSHAMKSDSHSFRLYRPRFGVADAPPRHSRESGNPSISMKTPRVFILPTPWWHHYAPVGKWIPAFAGMFAWVLALQLVLTLPR